MRTFKQLQDQVLANLDESGDTSTTLTLVKQFINSANMRRLGQHPWPFLRWYKNETLTMVASQRIYALHPECWRPIFFWNQAKKDYLKSLPERNFEGYQVDWNQDVDTGFFRLSSPMTLAAQPNGRITATTSSSSDNAKTITIRGVVAGAVTSETITISTLTAQTTATFTQVLNITLSAAFAGTLTFTQGATTLLTLAAGEYGKSYPTIELLYLPTAGEVVEYGFLRQPMRLSADNDIPEIPEPYTEILAWDALQLFGTYNTNMRAEVLGLAREMQAELERGLYQTYLEGQTLGSVPGYIHYVTQ